MVNNFYNNNRAVYNIVTISLLLVVSVVAFLVFSNWYSNYVPALTDDTLNYYSFDEEYVEFLSINNNSGSYELIIRNKIGGDFNVLEILIDDNYCSFIGDGIIYKNAITLIDLLCVQFSSVVSVVVVTQEGVVVSNVLVE
ncbi:MAG: hypothetical protein HRU03_03370 [Nanoarchaeales archaeon]|nr:hypothetical protein [Nanoarchaeales archaeon]